MTAGPDDRDTALPDPVDVDRLRVARAHVLQRIAGACERSGRDAASVSLVAVSKTVPAVRLRAAVAAGLTLLAENRVQEAAAKVPLVPGARWHLVGPLQSNKAGRAIRLFDVVETVDSVELAVRLDRLVRTERRAPETGPLVADDRLPVLLQVNVDRDPGKAGFDPDALDAALPRILGLGALEPAGLMTIGRLVADPELARPTFRALYVLGQRLRERHPTLGPALSMGMSDDYPVAIEEGATIVRVGRAIFGERPSA